MTTLVMEHGLSHHIQQQKNNGHLHSQVIQLFFKSVNVVSLQHNIKYVTVCTHICHLSHILFPDMNLLYTNLIKALKH